MTLELEGIKKFEQKLSKLNCELLDLLKEAQSKNIYIENIYNGNQELANGLFELKNIIERVEAMR